MPLSQRTYLITGGSSGLGAATARHLTQAGAHIAVVDINPSAWPIMQDELPAALFIEADITDGTAAQRAVAATHAHFGALHGLVNCAGTAVAEKTLSRRGPHSLESFERVVQINLVGSFNMARLAAAVMAENEPGPDGARGVILFTSSIAAWDGQMGQVAYAAAKGALASMTLPMARDLSAFGIRVVTLAPGVFDTPLLASLPAPAIESLAQATPFPKRLGRPEEFAALVAHILENPMLNGTVIRIDGGLRMG